MAMPESLKKAQKRYEGKIKRINLKFNTDYEQEVIDWLGGKPNRTEYIKSLIKKDMEGIK